MIKLNQWEISNDTNMLLIAGPCVIESETTTLNIAEKLCLTAEKVGMKLIFKASFDKANRTSIESYRGPGLKKGLEILNRIKQNYGVPIITDIHLPEQAQPVAEVVDMIQIPAFLSRQTDLLVAAAQTKKIINVKKGQFLAPWDMLNVIKKLEDAGNNRIMLTERGTSFGYNNLIVDMTAIGEMKKMGYPVIFDATHSVQKPGGMGTKSDGRREYVESLAKAATAVGVAGIFMEVHTDPETALSDGPNMVKLDELESILLRIKAIDAVVKPMKL